MHQARDGKAVPGKLCTHVLSRVRACTRGEGKSGAGSAGSVLHGGEVVVSQLGPGCPRHPLHATRACFDVRCQRTWTPDGAPTPEEQLARWVKGESVCPNSKHECCPDFSCCKSGLLWPTEMREKFAAAQQGEREKMMMGALCALTESVGEQSSCVTRGDPTDHE